jgi:hypothetical protein
MAMQNGPTTPKPSGRRRLVDFAPAGPAADTPAVTLAPSGPDVVVLRHTDNDTVEVCQGQRILTLVDHAEATPITDPARRHELVYRALRMLAALQHAAALQVEQARGERDRNQSEHERVLRAIRRYAIDRHLDNEFCRQGLDTFLERFNLDPYQPRLRVQVRITATIEVDTDDRSAAEYQVVHFLGLDLSDVDNAVEDSAEVQVSVTGLEPIHD